MGRDVEENNLCLYTNILLTDTSLKMAVLQVATFPRHADVVGYVGWLRIAESVFEYVTGIYHG
jgi:hypothetical protein